MTKLTLTVALSAAFAAQPALAATVTVKAVYGVGQITAGRPTTAAEIANDPTLAGKSVHDFLVTTSSDILRVGDVFISPRSSLYNNALGTDTEPPNPAFVAVFPALSADSWITTPGLTALAGAGGTTADNNSWFDTTNDGPQSNFLFARLTLSNTAPFIFSGVVSVLGENGNPEVHPFTIVTFLEPEPSSSALALGAVAALAFIRKRRGER